MDSEIYKITFDFQGAGIPELTDLTSKLNQIKNNNTQATTQKLDQTKVASSNLNNSVKDMSVGMAIGSMAQKEKIGSVGQVLKKVETKTKETSNGLATAQELVKVKSELRQSSIEANALKSAVKETQQKVAEGIMERDKILMGAKSNESRLTNAITSLKQQGEFEIKKLQSEIKNVTDSASRMIRDRDRVIEGLRNQIDRMRNEQFSGSTPTVFNRSAWKNQRQRSKMNKPQRGRVDTSVFDGVGDLMNYNQRIG